MAIPMEMNYAESGVDREQRKKAKEFGALFEGLVETPYNSLFLAGEKRMACLCVDGVGTKVLLAQAVGKHESIGVDGAAMVLNDCIRSGCKPIATSDTIDISESQPKILKELVNGFSMASEEAGAKVVSGETADVRELLNGMKGKAHYQMNCSCYGEAGESEVVYGNKIEAGDKIIGLRSSGLHSNGISLARKALFNEWGGAFDFFDEPEGIERPLAEEALVPTKIYVKPVLKAMKELEVKGAVHVTGDAYLKFKNLSRCSPIGFEFTNFKPQRIFGLIQEAAQKKGRVVRDEEMFKTFNMGWGFALVIPKKECDEAIQMLKNNGIESEEIGEASEKKGEVKISWKGRTFSL